MKTTEAQQKARAFDYGVLERKFQSALDADPDLAEADYNLGVLAERQGKKSEAQGHYRTALRKKPSLSAAAENLAVIAQNDGDLPGAVSLYQEILKQNPDDPGARARLAEIFRIQGDHDRAMEYARAALMREPKALLAYKVMMQSYFERKQYSMAKLVALRAMKIDESDPEMHYTLGQIAQAENDPDTARAEFRKAFEAKPDYLPALAQLARTAMRDENYAGAEQLLRKILQLDGKSAEAHLNLGIAYKGLGQFDKAMQEYDAAEKLDPRLSAVYLNRAILLHRHKDAPERALELYKKYLSLQGGEVALPAEAPVFGLIKEAEQLIAAKEEAKRVEEEQKKQEEQQKREAEKAKASAAAAPAGAKEPADVGRGEGRAGEGRDPLRPRPRDPVAARPEEEGGPRRALRRAARFSVGIQTTCSRGEHSPRLGDAQAGATIAGGARPEERR